jgi:hypothetical protein
MAVWLGNAYRSDTLLRTPRCRDQASLAASDRRSLKSHRMDDLGGEGNVDQGSRG